jgi:hypothetical protein
VKKLKLPGLRSAKPAPTDAATLTEAKPAVAKPRPIDSGWQIFRYALGLYRAHWKRYVKILAVVSVPVSIVSVIHLGSADAVAQSYVSFASIVMNVAFIWAAAQTIDTGKAPTVRSAYYDGSLALVRFVLVSFIIFAIMLPAAAGVALYVLGLKAADYYGVYGPELIFDGGLSLLLVALTVWLLVRFGLTPFAIVDTDLRPVLALRRIRALSLRRFWTIASRLGMLALFLIAVAAPSALIVFGLAFLPIGVLPLILLQILATLTVLPIGNLYLLRLYRLLEDTAVDTKKAVREKISEPPGGEVVDATPPVVA